MAARLIVNADDFGLTRGINRAIGELAAAGAITSATLMANGAAFEDAVAVAKAHPQLGVGCHVVLVDGVPVSPPESVPTLLGNDGRSFHPSLPGFIRDLFLGRIDPGEIEREALAQMQKLQRAGIDVTHLDTHKHTHVFPQVTRELVRITQHTSVASMRNPFEPMRVHKPASLRRGFENAILKQFKPAFEEAVGKTMMPDGTFGISATGGLNAVTLRQILNGLPKHGLFEILCHPGYNDSELDRVTTRLKHQREIEREALLTEMPKLLALPGAPECIHYGNLGSFGVLRDEGMFHPDTGYESY